MCRGFQQNERERLKIKAFYIHLSVSRTKSLPEFLTLHYLPRINGTTLEINGSDIKPDSPGFVTLHRVMSKGLVIYGSRERVKVCEGTRYEVYVGDIKVLKGIFRKDAEGESWKMECKCGLTEGDGDVEVKEAEVCVAAEGVAALVTEKVKMEAARRRRRRERGRCCVLEEIPEQSEVESNCSYCSCDCDRDREDVMDGEDEEMAEECTVEMEGVKWAMDVGIWVVCLGVGYLVSRASSKSLRRRLI